MKRRLAQRTALEGAGVLATLVGGTVLRFAWLPSRGLIYWDEAKFGLEGIRLQVALMALLGIRTNWEAGKAVGTAKPTHALLIAFMYALVGVHDYAPLVLNAAASVLQILVLYVLARTLFGPLRAVVSALLLAVSEYDIVYARSALSESDGNLFFLLGVLVLVRSVSRGRSNLCRASLAAGLLMGLAFTVNYRLIVYVGVACAAMFIWVWREHDAIPWPGFLFIPTFLIFPLAWQVAGSVAQSHGFDLFSSEFTGHRTSYLAEVVYQIHEGKQSAIHFQPVVYLQWYVLRQGWLASLFLVAGLFLAVRNRTAAWLFPAALLIVPYGVYVFAPFNVPRNLAAALPFASLLAAAAVVTVAGGIRARYPAVAIACLVLTLIGTSLSWRLTGVRSGFAAAARYIRAEDAGRSLTTTEVMQFYLRGASGQCLAPAMPLNIEGLSVAVLGGYRYAVTERHASSFVPHYIDTHARRAASYLAVGPVHLGESLISSENGDAPESGEHPEYVTVFRLSSLHLPAAAGSPVRCLPDRVV